MSPDDFWSRVVKSADGCWEWVGTKNGYGYGSVKIGGRKIGAHRYSWMLTNGQIQDGLFVCHSCDNPKCVNPAHLWLGTHLQNMADRKAKGRNERMSGENHGQSKLKIEDVSKIRDGRASGMSWSDLSKAYSVSRAQVRRICLGICWQPQPA